MSNGMCANCNGSDNILLQMAFKNNEDQILIKGKNQNQSISRNSKNENRSQFNESEELNQESLNDMYSTIQKDWYDLGITDTYQFQFHNSIKNLDEEELIHINNKLKNIIEQKSKK